MNWIQLFERVAAVAGILVVVVIVGVVLFLVGINRQVFGR